MKLLATAILRVRLARRQLISANIQALQRAATQSGSDGFIQQLANARGTGNPTEGFQYEDHSFDGVVRDEIPSRLLDTLGANERERFLASRASLEEALDALVNEAEPGASSVYLLDFRLLPDKTRPLFRVRTPRLERIRAAEVFTDLLVQHWQSHLVAARNDDPLPIRQRMVGGIPMDSPLLGSAERDGQAKAVRAKQAALRAPDPNSLEARVESLVQALGGTRYNPAYVLLRPLILTGRQENNLSITDEQITTAEQEATTWLNGAEAPGSEDAGRAEPNAAERLVAVLRARDALVKAGFVERAKELTELLATSASSYEVQWNASSPNFNDPELLQDGLVWDADSNRVQLFLPTDELRQNAELAAAHRTRLDAVRKVLTPARESLRRVERSRTDGRAAGRDWLRVIRDPDRPILGRWIGLINSLADGRAGDAAEFRKQIREGQHGEPSTLSDDIKALTELAAHASYQDDCLATTVIADELDGLKTEFFTPAELATFPANHPFITGRGSSRFVINSTETTVRYDVYSVKQQLRNAAEQRPIVDQVTAIVDAIRRPDLDPMARETLIAVALIKTQTANDNSLITQSEEMTFSLLLDAPDADTLASRLRGFVAAALVVREVDPVFLGVLKSQADNYRALEPVAAICAEQPDHPFATGILRVGTEDVQVFEPPEQARAQDPPPQPGPEGPAELRPTQNEQASRAPGFEAGV